MKMGRWLEKIKMENEIEISNLKEFEKKKKIFRDKDNLHVITDFDRTLTKSYVNKNKSSSLISFIYNGHYLSSNYSKKANKLYNYYRPIEINPNIPLEEKIEKMNEWWREHSDLLIKSGMNNGVIKDIVKKNSLHFRKGVLEFFNYLHKYKIPIVIMSAGPGQLIEGFLRKYEILYNNVHIIANYFIFDKNGMAIGRREPPIHTFNKKEINIKEIESPQAYKNLLKRKNVLLLGDTIGDIDMIEGFPYENVMKIGFLNENIDAQLKHYKSVYDAVILNDGDFNFVNRLVRGSENIKHDRVKKSKN